MVRATKPAVDTRSAASRIPSTVTELREPAEVVLPAFAAGGQALVWTWFATAWTYAILAVPLLLLPAVLGRTGEPCSRRRLQSVPPRCSCR